MGHEFPRPYRHCARGRGRSVASQPDAGARGAVGQQDARPGRIGEWCHQPLYGGMAFRERGWWRMLSMAARARPPSDSPQASMVSWITGRYQCVEQRAVQMNRAMITPRFWRRWWCMHVSSAPRCSSRAGEGCERGQPS
jgi:hypothetical protein